MVARESTTGDGSTEWVSVNACLIPAGLLEGQEVLTAEGLGTPASLHPVQRELAVRGGAQCGYCTPGFVCSMAAGDYRAERGHPEEEGGETDGEHAQKGSALPAPGGTLGGCPAAHPIRDGASPRGPPAANPSRGAGGGRPPPAARRVRMASDGAELVRPA